MAMLPLLFVMMLLSGVLCAVFLAAYATMEQPRHALTWAACFAAGAAQWAVNLIAVAFSTTAPWTWSMAMLTGTGSLFLAVVGYRQRSGLPVHARLMTVLLALVMAGAVVTRLSWARLDLYLMLLPACATLMFPFVVHAMLVRPGPRSTGERVAIAITVLLNLFEAVLTVLAARIGAPPDPGALALYRVVLMAGLPTLYIAMGISGLFVLMADQTSALNRLARRDALTGLLNRRGFRDTVGERLAESRRGCIVIGDIDHFKRINDRFGHAAGDLALKRVARALAADAREDDVVGRIGGEEFALFLAGADIGSAGAFVERLRIAIAAIAFPEHADLCVTMSFGVAPCRVKRDDLDSMLDRADKALYRAKTAGRDRVVAAIGDRTARRTPAQLDAARTEADALAEQRLRAAGGAR